MKIKKGDSVKIVIGKDSGKQGVVERVYHSVNKVLVPGVNEYKRHVKSRAQNQKSEIVTITKPLPISNVAVICPHCKKMTRIGWKTSAPKGRDLASGGEKVRVCRKCSKSI